MRGNRIAWLTLALLLVAAPAFARHVRFAGPHPIAPRYGGGYCYIEAPHIHIYGPETPALYAEGPEGYAFVGDPTPFGYEGDKYAFYGQHPVPGIPGAVCYIEGPHWHSYAPPQVPDYRVEKGVAFYVGAFPDTYYRERPHRARVVASVYAPYAALRPTVEVAPPPEWHGEVWITPPSPPTVVVGAPPMPGVTVVAPPPPSIVIGAPRPPSIVIGAPSPPSIVIGAPRPPTVVMGAPPAPGVVVVHDRGDDDDEHEGRWHHDNGLHKGWYKHHGR